MRNTVSIMDSGCSLRPRIHHVVIKTLAIFSVIFLLPCTGWSASLELGAGETIYSQNAAYYFGQVGGFIPFSAFNAPNDQKKTQTTSLSDINSGPSLHLFTVVYDLSFLATTPKGNTTQTYYGLDPAIGMRFPGKWGFWEGDLGGAWAYEPLPGETPAILGGIYAQTELLLRDLGPGDLDLFANYTGFISYIFTQASYSMPVGQLKNEGLSFDLGPELIVQGNNTYSAVQEGAMLGIEVRKIHSYFTLEAGLMQSTAASGIGEYEGVSWYFLY